MPVSLQLEIEGLPSAAVFRSLLAAAVEANSAHARREQAAGRELPCCLECTGLRYRPDRPAKMVKIHTGATLLCRGVASCGEVAAFWLGVERVRRGARVGDVELVQTQARPVILHAVVVLEDGSIYDPTLELPKG